MAGVVGLLANERGFCLANLQLKLTMSTAALHFRMRLRLQNQPVQILYWLVNQFVPPEDWKHKSRLGNTLVVQFDWRSRTKFVLAAF